MPSNSGNSLKQAGVFDRKPQQETYQSQTSPSGFGDFWRFRLKQHSSLNLRLKGFQANGLELIQDRNHNSRVDSGEVLARSKSQTLRKSDLAQGTYFIRVLPTTDSTNYRLIASVDADSSQSNSFSLNQVKSTGFGSWAATGDSLREQAGMRKLRTAAVAANRWNGSFINRDATSISDYSSYDFSNPVASGDLGGQGNSGKTVARLRLNFGKGSPASGVQRDYFAMQAWTRVQLQAGKFYQISSKSDDGIRFVFKNSQTGQVLSDVGGDWRDRRLQRPAWTRVISAPSSGQYDFYVLYYDKTGASALDVSLSETQPVGKVSASGGVNLRSQPSTIGNTPTTLLTAGKSFTVLNTVQSSNDTNYPTWYKVQTKDGKQGYVVADSSLVTISGNAIVLGNSDSSSGNTGNTGNTGGSGGSTLPNGNGSMSDPGSLGSGFGSSNPIAGKVWGGSISFRSDKSTLASMIAQLSDKTPVTILDRVTGSSYGNGFDQWYKVKVNVNGQDQQGYIAAYYVMPTNIGTIYPTSLSKSNSAFLPHLQEAVNPTYYSSSYKPMIEQVASKYSWLKPSIIAAIGSRESAWGLVLSPPGPAGTGDGGHGRGLMQIDDRFHQDFINSGRWKNPADNIAYGIDQVLKPNYDYLASHTSLKGIDLLRGAIASYNAGLGNVMDAVQQGLDVDYYTTGQDYSWDVINRAGFFQLNGWS